MNSFKALILLPIFTFCYFSLGAEKTDPTVWKSTLKISYHHPLLEKTHITKVELQADTENALIEKRRQYIANFMKRDEEGYLNGPIRLAPPIISGKSNPVYVTKARISEASFTGARMEKREVTYWRGTVDITFRRKHPFTRTFKTKGEVDSWMKAAETRATTATDSDTRTIWVFNIEVDGPNGTTRPHTTRHSRFPVSQVKVYRGPIMPVERTINVAIPIAPKATSFLHVTLLNDLKTLISAYDARISSLGKDADPTIRKQWETERAEIDAAYRRFLKKTATETIDILESIEKN